MPDYPEIPTCPCETLANYLAREEACFTAAFFREDDRHLPKEQRVRYILANAPFVGENTTEVLVNVFAHMDDWADVFETLQIAPMENVHLEGDMIVAQPITGTDHPDVQEYLKRVGVIAITPRCGYFPAHTRLINRN